MISMSWIGWALLSAVFAAATALLAKVGVAHVDSNLATAVRTSVVVVFAWGIALALGKHGARAWRVGIQHPRKPGPLATMELLDGEAIGTSGDYQRYFELNGKRYCHLIDPRNGYPAQGVQAVTILTQGEHAGLLSDGPSKPIFIAGTQGWRAAAQQMQVSEALLIDAEGVVHITAALQKRLEFTDKSTVRKIEP